VARTTRGRATQPTAKKTRRLSCELAGQDTSQSSGFFQLSRIDDR
jgi:hypothetical protein